MPFRLNSKLYSQLAEPRSEELVWDLRFAGDRVLFVSTLKLPKLVQALHQSTRELVQVLLSCTKRGFAAEAAPCLSPLPLHQKPGWRVLCSQGGCQALLGEETEA